MNNELHSLVGAYALDALDERERAAYEQHLAECPTCAAEVREFQATAARLGEAVSASPPAGLREAVLAAARRTPQQRPVVTVVPTSRWRRYAPSLLAAAAVLVVASVVALYFDEKDQKSELAAENSRIEAIMKAPDMVVSPTGPGDVAVKVIVLGVAGPGGRDGRRPAGHRPGAQLRDVGDRRRGRPLPGCHAGGDRGGRSPGRGPRRRHAGSGDHGTGRWLTDRQTHHAAGGDRRHSAYRMRAQPPSKGADLRDTCPQIRYLQ